MAALLGRLGNLENKDVDALPGAMRKLIVQTLEESIRYEVTSNNIIQAVETYRNFAEFAGREHDDVCVITFNYDCILDYALGSNTLIVNYGLPDSAAPTGRSIELLKLHGSLNWMSSPSGNAIHVEPLEPVGTRLTGVTVSGSHPGPLTATMAHSEIARRGIKDDDRDQWEPVIVPPTWSKAEHHRRLASVWRLAADRMAEAENIVVVGYSLPPTDEFFRYLFALGTMSATRLRRVAVFDANPSDAMNERYLKLVGPMAATRFSFKARKFEQIAGFLRQDGIKGLDYLATSQLGGGKYA
jgi:hypothetical protein